MPRDVTAGQFAAELLASTVEVVPLAAAVVKKAVQNVKDEGRANFLASAPVHNAGAARTINYDEPAVHGTRVESEVGFDRDVDKAASIAWLTEYGGGGDLSPAHRDIGRAADDEEPRFEDAIRRAVGRLL